MWCTRGHTEVLAELEVNLGLSWASGIQGETRTTHHKQLPLEEGHGREICYRTHYENITNLAQWSHSTPALGASFLPTSTSCSCWAEEIHGKGFWTRAIRDNLPPVMIAKYILHRGSKAIPKPLGSRTYQARLEGYLPLICSPPVLGKPS